MKKISVLLVVSMAIAMTSAVNAQSKKDLASDIKKLKEAYEELNNKLNGKIDSLGSQLVNHKTSVANDLKWMDQRITSVETELSVLRGMVEESYPNLEAYANDLKVLKKIVANREARHVYENGLDDLDPDIYFIGSFVTKSSKLTDKLRANLEKAMAKIKEKGTTILEIHGFASPTGPKALNDTLSKYRAQTVVSWFTDKGMDMSNAKVMYWGGVTKFGNDYDNQCVMVCAGKKKN